MNASPPPVQLRLLGRQPYTGVWEQMRRFTDERDGTTPDEFWVVEHPPVYTQGQAGLAEHIHNPGNVPVVLTDRGGQVTYHGPGQAVLYVLLDLRRAGIGVKSLVHKLESAVISLLARERVEASRRERAPGVYVGGCKLAALGLRIRRGCSYHGVAVNVDMDLSPFAGINPCGYQDLSVTRLTDLGVQLTVSQVGVALAGLLARELGLSLVGEGDESAGLPVGTHRPGSADLSGTPC